jgi:uncharacterized membrane-anchored protein YitT (DUF2179 family)
MMLLAKPPADRHTPLEDVQGILIGAVLVALSIQFLRAADLITGQIAGLALVASYAQGWSFGLTFFVLNLPFYALAVRLLGWGFVVKSAAAVTLMSVLSDALPLVLTVEPLHPALGAALFGVLAGVGLLSLFRHGSSLGGVGIVALLLQDRRGVPAGYTQLAFDLCVFAVAFALFPWQAVAWSILGAAILNGIVATNHRRDRYIARS